MVKIGQPPSAGGKIARGFFHMRKLLDSQRIPGQESQYRSLVSRINAEHGLSPTNSPLIKLASAMELSNFAVREITKLFDADRVIFLGKTGASSFGRLRAIAMAENRLIYVPETDSPSIFVSGQTGSDLLDIFEATAAQLRLDTHLPGGCGCAVVVPLITGWNRPLEEMERLGAIVVTHRTSRFFDPLVQLSPLRLIGDSLSAIIKIKNFSF